MRSGRFSRVKNGAGAGEVGGEVGGYVLGDAGVEGAVLAFEDVKPPCLGAPCRGDRFGGGHSGLYRRP